MRTSDFDYELPSELIASQPPERREDSRMMVIDRKSGSIEHRQFREFLSFIEPGDLTVMNDTRVIPARYFSNDGRIELLQLSKESERRWECMVKPGRLMKLGRTVEIGEATGTVEQILENGYRVIQFDQIPDAEEHGHLALPPYMNREDVAEDQERYQTVYAKREGAIAAPTAGLHFSPEIVSQLNHTFVTLHVGAGTFLPVKADEISEHEMHSEWFELSDDAAARMGEASRVISIGTTVVRVLEHCAQAGLPLKAQTGDTQIFIHPPYQFQVVDALLTNFHLPKSTLLMLISAFAGRELVLEAYAKAVEEKYRFYSYGDCMFLL